MEDISTPQRFGQLKSIHSVLTFAADPYFLENDIRVKPDLDALGALGDAGWYTITAILWAVDFELPKSVIASREPVFNKAGVILSCGASFLSNLMMDIAVAGTKGSLHLHDFVVNFEEDNASFSTSVETGFAEFETWWMPKPSEHLVTTDLPQEAHLVKDRLVGLIKAESAKPEMTWPTLSRKTRLVLDAVETSIDKGFESIEVRHSMN